MKMCKDLSGTIGSNVHRIEANNLKNYRVEALRRRINRVIKFMSNYPATGWYNSLLRGIILAEIKQAGITQRDYDYYYVYTKALEIFRVFETDEDVPKITKPDNSRYFRDFTNLETQKEWLKNIGVL